MPKRARLTGVDRLFGNGADVAAAEPPEIADAQSSSASASKARWDDHHHRRTFYCEDSNWAALQAWCKRTGTSHSAALNAAIEAFLSREAK